MKNRAIFLDRDGTINIDYGYVSTIDKFHFIPGIIDLLRKLSNKGYLLIVVSNQSGIGRGYYKEEDAIKVFDYMVDELKKNGAIISKYYYCPHYNEECNCRKPKTGLIDLAVKEFNIDLEKSFMIGDKDSDILLAKNINVKSILVKNDLYINNIKPDFIAEKPEDILTYILESENL